MNSQNIANILADDDFKEVLQTLKDNQLNLITNSLPKEQDIREQAYNRIAAINELIGNLESIAANIAIDENRFKIL